MRVRVGLAAWSNRHFDNALYYPGTPHDEYLPRYSRMFDCAEADVLHHRTLDAATLRQWAGETPMGFRFLPKMSKQATHSAVLRGSSRQTKRYAWLRPQLQDAPGTAEAQVAEDRRRAEEFVAAVGPLREAGRLGPILLQFAHETEREEGFDRLQSILACSPPGTFAVELRHNSWFVPAVRALLEDAEAPLVWSTYPDAFAPPWVTGEVGYVRFTGKHRHMRGRHVTVADRAKEVDEMAKRLDQAAWKECFAIVTNPFEGNAVDSLPKVAAAFGLDSLAKKMKREPGRPLLA